MGVVIIHMYVCITQRQTMRFVDDLPLMYTTHAPEPVRIDVRMYICCCAGPVPRPVQPNKCL